MAQRIAVDPITRIEGHLRIEATADKIGLGLVAATAVAFGAHGIASAFRKGDEMESDKVKKED